MREFQPNKEFGKRIALASVLFALSAHTLLSETIEDSVDRLMTEGFKKLGDQILSDVQDTARNNAVNASVAEDSLGVSDLMSKCSMELAPGSHLRKIIVERATELRESGFTEDQSLFVANSEYGRGVILVSIQESKTVCETLQLSN